MDADRTPMHKVQMGLGQLGIDTHRWDEVVKSVTVDAAKATVTVTRYRLDAGGQKFGVRHEAATETVTIAIATPDRDEAYERERAGRVEGGESND
jgi:hypothetical protein